MNEGSEIRDLHRHLSDGLAALGRQLDIQDDLPQILEENGFRDLNHREWPVPLGPWPKDEELVLLDLVNKERPLTALAEKNRSLLVGSIPPRTGGIDPPTIDEGIEVELRPLSNVSHGRPK